MTAAVQEHADQALLFDSSFGADLQGLPGEFKPNKAWFTKENGKFSKLVMSKVPIFRSGTFRDSWGDQYTYEKLNIEDMARNFDHLRASGILADVPVRCNHPGFVGNVMRDVIGYVTSLRAEDAVSPVDGKTYTYLFADYDILDEEAAEKIDSTLWRNRSSEVGTFRTNAEAEFWPTLVGFAYVDIPAVEGLQFSKSGKNTVDSKFTLITEKEMPKMGAENPGKETTTEVTAPAPQNSGETKEVAAHSASAPAPHAFTIAGQAVTDFAKVQEALDRIPALEQYQADNKAAIRADFVASLASSNKITETQKIGLDEFCKDLTDAQFTAWKSTWDSAPVAPLLANHATGAVTEQPSTNAAVGGSADDAAITTAKEVVDQFRKGGMSEDRIKQTGSYKRLVAAGIEKE